MNRLQSAVRGVELSSPSGIGLWLGRDASHVRMDGRKPTVPPNPTDTTYPNSRCVFYRLSLMCREPRVRMGHACARAGVKRVRLLTTQRANYARGIAGTELRHLRRPAYRSITGLWKRNRAAETPVVLTAGTSSRGLSDRERKTECAVKKPMPRMTIYSEVSISEFDDDALLAEMENRGIADESNPIAQLEAMRQAMRAQDHRLALELLRTYLQDYFGCVLP